jgi:hypothetical protein
MCSTKILCPPTKRLPAKSVRATRLFLRFETQSFGKEKEAPCLSIPEEEESEENEDGVPKHMFGVPNELVRPIHCWCRRCIRSTKDLEIPCHDRQERRTSACARCREQCGKCFPVSCFLSVLHDYIANSLVTSSGTCTAAQPAVQTSSMQVISRNTLLN